MICNAFTCKTNVWLLAALMMFFGDVAMASSLKLADPSELAGQWQATLNATEDSSKSCIVDFQPQQTLGEGAECLSSWFGEQAIGWFPEPDGIAITGKEGSRIVFFSRQHEGLYTSTLKSGLIITLQRTAH